ncbi:MAG: NAD(P)-dependent glycerol-3-phosphate dehydrogenase [Cyclobacteriaceae bacterium]|nr:NAD(P)-dependent glycerol-3-phosphate dehydrogenase [Cyclobacteriaceae bacterium]
MTSEKKRPVAVLGAGSFGISVANLLATHDQVLLYSRSIESIEEMNREHCKKGYKLHDNITATNDLESILKECHLIFPVVPSYAFRDLMRTISPMLHPYHILIHGTKGLDIQIPEGKTLDDIENLSRKEVKTMSEVIADETSVIRVGCLAGPNLAKELADNQPAATVVASHFEEVISMGIKHLRNDRFQVYGNSDLIGIELAGVLKNIIAIAAGALHGLGMGENAKGLLISRGMIEIMYMGRAMGGDLRAFLGLAGIGDLVATCNSTHSRNFTVGYRLAKGEKLDSIIESMDEVAEGVNTIKIMKRLTNYYKVRAPITQALYTVLYKDVSAEEALQYLMNIPFNVDIEFLKKLD